MRDPAFQPIETEWNGYRFRSRLEARWAVFFDTLGIPYEYEVQGYRIDGVPYLPDFWLPKQDCWFEVKPEQPPLPYLRMLKRFSDQSGKAMVLADHPDFRRPFFDFDRPDDRFEISAAGREAMIAAAPEAERYLAMQALDSPIPSMVGAWINVYRPVQENDCEGFPTSFHECAMCAEDDTASLYVSIDMLPSWQDHQRRQHQMREEHTLIDSQALRDAYRAARQARFEHGERRWPR